MGNQSHRVPVSEIRAAVLDDTRAKNAAHGWTVIGVFPTPEDPGPLFAYTVGWRSAVVRTPAFGAGDRPEAA